MAVGLAAFEQRLEALGKELDGTAKLARLKRVAADTKGDIDRVVRADIGDLSMSGWRRTKPIAVKGAFKVEGATVVMVPSAPGPMRVLQQGRNQGNAGGMAGPGVFAKGGGTVRKKNGQVKATRARKAKRWNGRTTGKDTWTDATAIMVTEVPARYAREVHAALLKHLTGG